MANVAVDIVLRLNEKTGRIKRGRRRIQMDTPSYFSYGRCVAEGTFKIRKEF